MGSVHLPPNAICEKSFEVEENISFNPSKLECPEKEKIAEAVIKMLKKMINVSNANLVKNADGLLSKKKKKKKKVNDDVEWISKEKKHLPDNRYKMSY